MEVNRGRMLLPLLFACTGMPLPNDTSGNDTGTDTAPPGIFTLSLPGNPSSEGNALADQCAFELPVQYECYNPNPALHWENAPAGTAAFALLFDDPDAGDFPHWAVVNIPATETGLDEGISGRDISPTLPDGAYELENGFGYGGYLGSCPGSPHVYRWRLWALADPLPHDLSRFGQVENQAMDQALGEAATCHIYGPATE